ncbi:GPW/gp25 family protein [Candidatus Fukatsuia symbiotica]|uniref:Baseplate assembly protein n=3 Tax=Candidatus Fukatsuia symbiotica TaxID=1878942 RepID=A0A2U8I6H3_9GAMM|nr:GPW/gp25 family protein [Candidatus Fukatsuia symbiotica]AWK14752.1 baseplate assembly protein [Candidatus Fukatsuia symbiotica]MEA9445085.1 GPW/gp25 family protein [Candidatus Fukatsuia symbiotica]
MTYLGMHRHSGQAISDIAHIRQSISDILITPQGSRVMRRAYGSLLSTLIDSPQSPALRLRMMAAIYSALLRWENRLTLSAIDITSDINGIMQIDLRGHRSDTGVPLRLSLPIGGK